MPVLAIGDRLLHRSRIYNGADDQVRPERSQAWSAKANAEFRADQGQARNDVISFMDSVEAETRILTHSSNHVVETRRDST